MRKKRRKTWKIVPIGKGQKWPKNIEKIEVCPLSTFIGIFRPSLPLFQWGHNFPLFFPISPLLAIGPFSIVRQPPMIANISILFEISISLVGGWWGAPEAWASQVVLHFCTLICEPFFPLQHSKTQICRPEPQFCPSDCFWGLQSGGLKFVKTLSEFVSLILCSSESVEAELSRCPIGGIQAVDTFPYRFPIVDRGTIAAPLFASPFSDSWSPVGVDKGFPPPLSPEFCRTSGFSRKALWKRAKNLSKTNSAEPQRICRTFRTKPSFSDPASPSPTKSPKGL